MKKYKTPREAETAYFGRPPSSHGATQPTSTQSSTQSSNVPTIVHLFEQLPLESQLQTISSLFSSYVSAKYNITIPDDYLEYSAMAMANLKCNARSNVLYNLAKGMGSRRADGSDSRFPVKRMPMGLIEYAASFFACDNLQSVSTCVVKMCLHKIVLQISCPLDYRLWQQSMYCHFGQKWVRMHCGPAWGVLHSVQEHSDEQFDARKQCTMEVIRAD